MLQRCYLPARKLGSTVRFLGIIALGTLAPRFPARSIEPITLVPEGQIRVPPFEINGAPTRIHTQGLYVTDRYFYATGRLEGSVKRALFLRIPRDNPASVEQLDITPSESASSSAQGQADHPGGFDFDGEQFWIPISPSKPETYCAIVKVRDLPGKPLASARVRTAFAWNDHIGAIAIDRESRKLFGANWDTEVIYAWDSNGALLNRLPRANLNRPDTDTILAVQDWKFVGDHQLLAAGLDKNPNRDPKTPRALVEILDSNTWTVIAATRIPRPSGTPRDVTNEGLAVHGDSVFFLPGDLGIEAVIYSYHWRR